MDAANTRATQRVIAFATELHNMSHIQCDTIDDLTMQMDAFTIDFTVGQRDAYIVWDGDALCRAIPKSGISIGADDDAQLMHPQNVAPAYLQVEEVSVRLPPYQDGADEWQAHIECGDTFTIRTKSCGMSTQMTYQNPHIELDADSCSLDDAMTLITDVHTAYQETQDELLAHSDNTVTGFKAQQANIHE